MNGVAYDFLIYEYFMICKIKLNIAISSNTNHFFIIKTL
jgi:hypothetical protein